MFNNSNILVASVGLSNLNFPGLISSVQHSKSINPNTQMSKCSVNILTLHTPGKNLKLNVDHCSVSYIKEYGHTF